MKICLSLKQPLGAGRPDGDTAAPAAAVAVVAPVAVAVAAAIDVAVGCGVGVAERSLRLKGCSKGAMEGPGGRGPAFCMGRRPYRRKSPCLALLLLSLLLLLMLLLRRDRGRGPFPKDIISV